MRQFILYRGANGDRILEIVSSGIIFPDRDNKIYFGEYNREDCYQHGGDRKRAATFVIYLKTAPLADNEYFRARTPGTINTFVVQRERPLNVSILALYARTRDPEGSLHEEKVDLNDIKEYLKSREQVR